MRRSALTVTVMAALVALALVTQAFAATKNGITPVSPKSKIAKGKQPTFKVKVTGPGTVWIHVCKRAKKDSKGLICHTAAIGQARKKGSTFNYKPKVYTFPGFWLQTPGTYYWQAHRISCEGDLDDCSQEGPVVRIKVG